MQLTWHPIAGLVFLVTANACSGMSNGTPTGPSAPPVSFQPASLSNEVTPASGRGTIAVREFSPGPGGMLAVHDNCPSGSVTRRCTNDWHGTLDVVVDREMITPSLWCRSTRALNCAATPPVRETWCRQTSQCHSTYRASCCRTSLARLPSPASSLRRPLAWWLDSGLTPAVGVTR